MRSVLAVLVFAILSAAGAGALAQESASYKLEESVFNSGGHPGGGPNPTSASHHLTLGSIGDPVTGGLASSPSFHLNGNFVSAYPPPGETRNLGFNNKQTLRWNPESSAGRYNLYRDSFTSLSGLGFGACLQQNITGTTTTDTAVPAGQQGFFYLVTTENRLTEEGTKGFRSNGAERAGTVCP